MRMADNAKASRSAREAFGLAMHAILRTDRDVERGPAGGASVVEGLHREGIEERAARSLVIAKLYVVAG